MSAAPSLIDLRSASFGYGDRSVVSGVDLTIRPGEVVALLGPNGSGKSTLVKGLLGLTEHQGGQVLLLGTPREHFREHTRIGYVPQRHSLSTSVRATVTEIVAVGRLPHRPWWRPASREDREIVAASIRAVGLADRAGEEVASLSGGQQRRVLIARALAGQPELLVMDEPTAGVDRASQVALAETLRGLAARGTSMLVVTHELAALRDVVTRIVCMDSGHVDFDGPTAAYAAHVAAHAPGSTYDHTDRPRPPAPVGGPFDRPEARS
ncbi:metal ABC transporter ATP-binding protein [Phycicoccus endophyticus]|uniref:Metal ABC transporter ATP-binding protein n=1 Tax=Phycicoccus endophyticus TaxID=1690220 RepID=A0A7G9R5N4_9MICO|nr:metal ABC transporter ATP-binding protein [Phycicoccus endophyticus]NHI18128.1 metal ABC transporter ATP-binding protein [Phycicoccus endophyticus]QNN50909.1 metal ABC transporter ATP-binding protein [Phycicoccus endophyticus]